MSISISADFSNTYQKDVADVGYSFTKFSIELDEDIEITFGVEQFENLLKKMIETYTNVAGEDGAEKLIASTRERREVV
jgi:hypothetical protein